MQPLTMVVARAHDGVIGRDGGISWRVPEDLRRFKKLTMGHACIVGRKTWEKLPPLPGRRLVVLSPSMYRASNNRLGFVADTIEMALWMARQTDPSPFVIGGAEVYRAALPYVTRIELTEIDLTISGDTRLDLDLSAFREVARVRGENPLATFVTLVRR